MSRYCFIIIIPIFQSNIYCKKLIITKKVASVLSTILNYILINFYGNVCYLEKCVFSTIIGLKKGCYAQNFKIQVIFLKAIF